jgi:catechol-2,3-dioxygenase
MNIFVADKENIQLTVLRLRQLRSYYEEIVALQSRKIENMAVGIRCADH